MSLSSYSEGEITSNFFDNNSVTPNKPNSLFKNDTPTKDKENSRRQNPTSDYHNRYLNPRSAGNPLGPNYKNSNSNNKPWQHYSSK